MKSERRTGTGRGDGSARSEVRMKKRRSYFGMRDPGAAIRNFFLAILLVGAFSAMRFAGINFLLILLIAGVVNLIVAAGVPPLLKKSATRRMYQFHNGTRIFLTSANV